MTLAVLESTLPNGFHDAKMTAINRDLRAGSVEIHVDILVGLPDDIPTLQNQTRQGVLKFNRTKLIIIEKPDADSPFSSRGGVNFVLTEDEAGSLPDELLKKLTVEDHVYIFFVQEWFSNIKVAAASIEFLWA